AVSTCGGSANDRALPLESALLLQKTREACIDTPGGAIAHISDSGTGSESGVKTPIRASEPAPSGCQWETKWLAFILPLPGSPALPEHPRRGGRAPVRTCGLGRPRFKAIDNRLDPVEGNRSLELGG